MSATLLIGYDVESIGRPEVTRAFLAQAERLHTELEAPCTLFLCGRVIEENREALERVADNPLFDLQQHTYSHVLLKTVCIDDGSKIEVHRGGTLAQIEDEVGRTSALIREFFGRPCLGITGPYAYYRGLSDRPDILEILFRLGIRFTRTYGRNHNDWQPVEFSVQPSAYAPQGFPEMLEIPLQGWQDVYWRNLNGYDNLKGYRQELERCADAIAESGRVWGYGSHDWSSLREDPEMSLIRGLIQYARGRGIILQSYFDFYRRWYAME